MKRDELKEDGVYHASGKDHITTFIVDMKSSNYMYDETFSRCFSHTCHNYTYREATYEERSHLEACILANGYVEPIKIQELYEIY